MSLFGKILTKLGLKKDDKEAAAPAAPEKKEVKPAPVKPSSAVKGPVPAQKPAAARSAPIVDKPEDFRRAAAPAAVPMVDVMSKLETMSKGTGLDWKVSIVDLLKVLGLDSSKAARKELAVELGCPPDQMKDPELKDMNTWLHKTVLAKIAENGGNIPKELLD